MKTARALIAICIPVFIFGLLIWGLYTRAAARMEVLSTLVAAEQRRVEMGVVQTTLTRLAHDPEVAKLDPATSCKNLKQDLQDSQGFFAVLAVGDATGKPVCTGDPAVAPPLPTMSDRDYFARVKVAKEMVTGEFATSKTTGKAVLHFAYPILMENGTFRGFVLAAVDLAQFETPDLETAFVKEGVMVMAIDGNGNLLYRYPQAGRKLGQYSVSAELVNALLSGGHTPRVVRGDDGVWRVYAYHWVSVDRDYDVAVVAGVSILSYLPIIFGLGLLSVIMGFHAWFILGRVGSRQVR